LPINATSGHLYRLEITWGYNLVDAGSTGNQNTGEAILQIDVGVLREHCLWTLKTSVSDGIPVTQNKHALHRETFKLTMKIIYILSVPQTLFRVTNINVCWNSSSLNDSATFLTLILCFRGVFFFLLISHYKWVYIYVSYDALNEIWI
jgi:hypothetical protein